MKRLLLAIAFLLGLWAISPAEAQIICVGPNCPGGGGAAASIGSGTTAITGGADTQVCFNDAAFVSCGDSGFTFNKTTNVATLLGGATIGAASSSTGVLTLFHASHAFFNVFQQSASQGASITYTLPTTDGGASEFLQTNGSGVLTWAAAGGSITCADTGVIYADGANTPACDATDFNWNKTTNALTASGSVISPLHKTAPGVAIAVTATAPTATTGASQVGVGAGLAASAAVASTDTAGAAAGGAVTITAGAAARNTSGNANGGSINLVGGAGIGTGTAGQVIVPNSILAAAPSIGTAGATSSGIGFNGQELAFVMAGTVVAGFQQYTQPYGFQLLNGQVISWGAAVNGASDLVFSREAAAVFQVGLDANGAATNQTFKAHDGVTGTDISGAKLTIAAGRGTGAGTGGTLAFQTAPILGTGTTAQTLADRLTISKAGAVTYLYQLVSGSALPAVGDTSANSCGTTAATIAGTNETGIITVGATAGTSCTVTFTVAAPTRRQCMVNNETTANLARSTYSTTTISIFAGTFVAGDVISYTCMVY